MAYEITDSNFKDTINSGKLVLIDFWAIWCGPCRALEPIIEQLSNEYKGKNVVIAKMNTDKNKTPQALGIRSIPTLILFKNGEIVDRLAERTKEGISAKINQYI